MKAGSQEEFPEAFSLLSGFSGGERLTLTLAP